MESNGFWAANRYKGWNGEWVEGKIHEIDALDTARLMCGKKKADVPGFWIPRFAGAMPKMQGDPSGANCKGCIKGMESRGRRIEWEKESERRQTDQEEKQKQWWENYERYLRSDAWKDKRELVMHRADRRCEGCAKKFATQVHHLSYEHVGRELLFELVALCDDCHEAAHQAPVFYWTIEGELRVR